MLAGQSVGRNLTGSTGYRHAATSGLAQLADLLHRPRPLWFLAAGDDSIVGAPGMFAAGCCQARSIAGSIAHAETAAEACYLSFEAARMSRQVLVIGGMPDAGYVVEELLALGYPVAWVWQGDLPANGDRRSLVTYPYSTLLAITGFVGEFRLRIRSPEERTLEAGCVVATGNERIFPRQTTSSASAHHHYRADGRATDACSGIHHIESRQHVLFALDLTGLRKSSVRDAAPRAAYTAIVVL